MSPVESWLAHLIDAVRINVTTAIEVDGRRCFRKKRCAGRGSLIMAGNLFLKWSHSQIRMFPRCADWQAWELHSYRLLHGTERLSRQPDARSILLEALPGMSLDELRRESRLTAAMMRAAAQEFRRVHYLTSSLLNAPWSHGDPHFRNVLYEPDAQQAHLIDFETRHENHLSANERHADDVLVFLLDLCGGTSDNRADLCRVFLAEYARPEVNVALMKRLHMPAGWERILWQTRTHHLSQATLARHLTLLRQMLLPTIG